MFTYYIGRKNSKETRNWNLEVTNLGEEESKNSMYSQQKWLNPRVISCYVAVKQLLLIGKNIDI